MIQYHTDLDDITADDLDGFFVGWPSHPDLVTHLRMLRGADGLYFLRGARHSRGVSRLIDDEAFQDHSPARTTR